VNGRILLRHEIEVVHKMRATGVWLHVYGGSAGATLSFADPEFSR
jgi:hypothetical protein